MSKTVSDLKSQLLAIEKEANLQRQKLEDSQYTETIGADGKPHVEIITDDSDWDFAGAGRSARGKGLIHELASHLSVLQSAGDRIKIGPYKTAATARAAQSQLSNAINDKLKWPRKSDGEKLLPSYESHIRETKAEGVWLYVMRNYAPDSD